MPQATEDRGRVLTVPYPIEEGTCYLVKGKSVDSSYRLASHYADEGVPVLCVSRLFPDRLRSHYGLGSATVWWISESPGDGHFDPTAVGSLSTEIERFVESHPEGSLIVLDGIEFISVNTGFLKAILFIEHLNEYVMPRRTTLLVPVDPECFDPIEFARLDRFTGGIVEEELRDALDTFDANRTLGL